MKTIVGRLRCVAGVAVLAAGCARAGGVYPPPIVQPLPAPPPPPEPAAIYAARSILHNDEDTRPGLAATGFVVLTHRPIEHDAARYRILCDAFVATMEPASFFKNLGSKTITYWPVARSRKDSGRDTCGELVERYNYAFASMRVAELNLSDRKGPLLVAYRPTPGTGQRTWLILDMSNFSDNDVERAFRIWKQSLSTDAGSWFTLVKAREAFRDFVQQYGEPTVAIVEQ